MTRHGIPPLGARVRVHLNHGGILAEGEVIGWYDHPTYIVRTASGEQVSCSSQLRYELAEPEPRQIDLSRVVAVHTSDGRVYRPWDLRFAFVDPLSDDAQSAS